MPPRSRFGKCIIPERTDTGGGGDALRARALVLRTEPRRSRVSALRASIPIAGAPPASRRFAGRLVARLTHGHLEHEHALAEFPEAGDADPFRHASAAVPQVARSDGAKARPAGADHRRFRTSSAFARGGGSSSQMSSPGNTMPSIRLPSASKARKRLAAPERDARTRWRPSRTTRLRTVAAGEFPPGGERLEAGRGHHVRLAGDVVQPGAGGVDRHGAVAQPGPHPVGPLPARALAADRGRRCPLGGGCGLGRHGLWLRGVRGGAPWLLPPAAHRGRTRAARDRAGGRSGASPPRRSREARSATTQAASAKLITSANRAASSAAAKRGSTARRRAPECGLWSSAFPEARLSTRPPGRRRADRPATDRSVIGEVGHMTTTSLRYGIRISIRNPSWIRRPEE